VVIQQQSPDDLLIPGVDTPDSPSALRQSYAYCERLARREAANFYHAFRLLPRDQRQAMCALYSFMRVTDDLTDGPGPVGEKCRELNAWRRHLDDALAGHYSHPLHAAFHHTVELYRIPRAYLDAVLDGVAMDLDTDRYETFAELYRYCYRVASAVGLACLHIWGYSGEGAERHAEAAGIAFQLTNILRDLGEDAGRGRVYLPREDLSRFGFGEQDLLCGLRDERYQSLMQFEAERAYSYYEAAAALVPLLPPAGRSVFLVMQRTYRGLLDAIVRHDFDVFGRRIRLSRLHKLWLAARVLPVRFGLA
jgi:phytoene synthase